MRPDVRILEVVAGAGLIGAAAPLCLLWLAGLGAPSAEAMVPWMGGSVVAAAVGLGACAIAIRRRRSAASILLGLLLLIPAVLSTALLVDGLRERAYSADLVLCGTAERDGRTIRRHERGYATRLDQDGDGLACEPVLGPHCHQGRCAPFG